MIRMKRVYDPRSPEDGIRVLCTRLWPRGVRRDGVDLWLKELGAPAHLIRPYLDGQITPAEFRAGVEAALGSPAAQDSLARLAELVRQGKTLTLMSSARTDEEVHLKCIRERLPG